MIGSDFEQFLKLKDALVPVTDELALGSKFGAHVPLTNGSMHRDNVMVELCIPPASTAEQFADSCVSLSQEAVQYLTDARGLEDVTLSAQPVAQFSSKQLESPSAKEIGCDVDYLAMDTESVERPRIDASSLENIRCAGGHIHISYGCTDRVPEAIAASFCDVALGGLELHMGSQRQRREFYGLAGLHRRKSYGAVAGVEYRTVSNLWLGKRDHAIAMGRNALALERLFNNASVEELGKAWESLLEHKFMQIVLRQERKAEATRLLKKLNALFPSYKFATGV